MAVVASRTGGLPEIVRDGETGLLVAPGDPVALADALRSLADQPERRAALGNAAAARAAERFGLPRMLSEVGDLYERVLARKARP